MNNDIADFTILKFFNIQIRTRKETRPLQIIGRFMMFDGLKSILTELLEDAQVCCCIFKGSCGE